MYQGIGNCRHSTLTLCQNSTFVTHDTISGNPIPTAGAATCNFGWCQCTMHNNDIPETL